MVTQRKGEGHVDILPPGMIRNAGPHFGQTLDQTANGLRRFFTMTVMITAIFENLLSELIIFSIQILSTPQHPIKL
jgi:hypothetical protein